MATQDFTTYTEVDPSGIITVTSGKVAFNGDCRDGNANYVYKDFGAAYFDGDLHQEMI